MVSREHKEKLGELFDRLTEEQEKSLDRIDRRLRSAHARFLQRANDEYRQLRQEDGLPSLKGEALFARLEAEANITDGDWQDEFDRLLSESGSRARDAAREFLEMVEGKNDNETLAEIDQIIDFWKKDSDRLLREKWGEGYRQSVRNIARESFNRTPKDGQQFLNDSLNRELAKTQIRAKTIVRQSSNSVANEAAIAQYEKDGLEFVLWVAIEDDRICPYCLARNQGIYRIRDVVVPAHIRCRCLLLPVKREWLVNGKFDKDLARQDADDGLEVAARKNVKPKNEAAELERNLGREKAPTPLWTPGGGWQKGERPKRITKPQLRYLSLTELKELAASQGISKERVKRLGKGSLAKGDTWRRAIAANSRLAER